VSERDKYLTEAMGECWHEANDLNTCVKCNYPWCAWLDYSTWEGFGKLKDFMCNLPDSERFFDSYIDELTQRADDVTETFRRLQPDHFADVVYEFLKERDK
jgi:hypothetical protein